MQSAALNLAKLKGMSFPFRRNDMTDFPSVESEKAIMLNVAFALSTPLGFLPWRPDFGSRLHTVRHQNDTLILREIVGQMIGECLTKWCPYVRVVKVTCESFPRERKLRITILYRVVRNQIPVGPEISHAFTITTAG